MANSQKTRHLLGISGKDSACTAIVLKAHHPEIWEEVELFTNEVKTEYPDKQVWLTSAEEYLGKPIYRIEADLDEIILKKSKKVDFFLPSRKIRYCTEYAKIKPMKRWLKGTQGVIYIGLRSDEQDRKGYTPDDRFLPKYPLIEKGIDLPKVFAILSAVNLLPPSYFWQRLYDRVKQIIKERNSLLDLDLDTFLSPIQKYTLFRGRSRDNCYFCFFQRQYEWVWLAETYPDLFDKSCWYEDLAGEYTWRSDGTLQQLLERKEEIFEKHAQKVATTVEKLVFGNPVTIEQDELDFYAGRSCGLFCGK